MLRKKGYMLDMVVEVGISCLLEPVVD